MERVGVRELRNNLSHWLRVVKEGDAILITERGRVVARLTPVEYIPTIERLIAEGKIRPPLRPRTRASAKDRIRAKGGVSDLVRDQRR